MISRTVDSHPEVSQDRGELSNRELAEIKSNMAEISHNPQYSKSIPRLQSAGVLDIIP